MPFWSSTARQYTPCSFRLDCGNRRPPSQSIRKELYDSSASGSLLNPFLDRPLSCLVLFGGYIPVWPVAQVAKPGILASAMPSTHPAEKAGFVFWGHWALLAVITGNWARASLLGVGAHSTKFSSSSIALNLLFGFFD